MHYKFLRSMSDEETYSSLLCDVKVIGSCNAVKGVDHCQPAACLSICRPRQWCSPRPPRAERSELLRSMSDKEAACLATMSLSARSAVIADLNTAGPTLVNCELAFNWCVPRSALLHLGQGWVSMTPSEPRSVSSSLTSAPRIKTWSKQQMQLMCCMRGRGGGAGQQAADQHAGGRGSSREM
jgi:hypothetical protein